MKQCLTIILKSFAEYSYLIGLKFHQPHTRNNPSHAKVCNQQTFISIHSVLIIILFIKATKLIAIIFWNQSPHELQGIFSVHGRKYWKLGEMDLHNFHDMVTYIISAWEFKYLIYFINLSCFTFIYFFLYLSFFMFCFLGLVTAVKKSRINKLFVEPFSLKPELPYIHSCNCMMCW